MAELLVFAMKDNITKGIVVDNIEAGGAWPKEIYEIITKQIGHRSKIQKKKMATLTNSIIKNWQTNRLSKESGIQDTSRTFNSEFNDEVKAFLLD